ncbi:MAG TPA: hypothetical protein ENN42_11035 [Thioalkalivibrio sp.]|nr:hypothetical protein [Thioalkalivibrio sp.]
MKPVILAAGCILAVLALASPALADDRYRDYDRYDGYRELPYDRHRHHYRNRHHEHRGHRYAYQGHWRSWDEWDRYTRRHPELRRHGRYYYEGAHLMFRTCPPDSNTCIYFSIGR